MAVPSDPAQSPCPILTSIPALTSICLAPRCRPCCILSQEAAARLSLNPRSSTSPLLPELLPQPSTAFTAASFFPESEEKKEQGGGGEEWWKSNFLLETCNPSLSSSDKRWLSNVPASRLLVLGVAGVLSSWPGSYSTGEAKKAASPDQCVARNLVIKSASSREISGRA